MACDDCFECFPQRRLIQGAAQLESERLIEGTRGFVAETGRQPDFHLGLGQRNFSGQLWGANRWRLRRRQVGNLPHVRMARFRIGFFDRFKQEAAGLQFFDALLEGADDRLEVGVGVGGGQKARESFLNMDALLRR